MLDFYWLTDTEETPEYPDESRYVGSLSLRNAENLKCVWDMCAHVGIPSDYDNDVRLRSDQVTTLLNCCTRCYEENTNHTASMEEAYTSIMNLLKSITERGLGIVVFSD